MKALWLASVCILVFLQQRLSAGKTLPRKGAVYSLEPLEEIPDLLENEWDWKEEVAERSFESINTEDEDEQLDDSDEESHIRYDRVWWDQSQEKSPLPKRDQTRRASVHDPYFDCRVDSSHQDGSVEGIAPVQGMRDPCDSEFKILPLDTSCGCYMTCFNGYRQVLGCSDGYLFDRGSLACRPASEVNNCGSKGPENVLKPEVTTPPITTTRTPRIIYPLYPDQTQERLRCPSPFGLHPHPSDCRLFLNCDRGTPHVQSCGRGTVFSKRYHVCTYPNLEDCGHQF